MPFALVPWRHHIEIITKCDTIEKALFYIGKTIEQAYEMVMKFIDHARRHEFRCILIIHGKGERANPKALMKSHVAHWLKQIPDILAYHSAPDFKGGTGALCIILKKGDKASIVNREIYGRR